MYTDVYMCVEHSVLGSEHFYHYLLMLSVAALSLCLFLFSLLSLSCSLLSSFSSLSLTWLGSARPDRCLVSSPSRRLLLFYISFSLFSNYFSGRCQSNTKLFSKPEASQRIEDNWCIQSNTSVQGCSVLVREDSTSKAVNFVS